MTKKHILFIYRTWIFFALGFTHIAGAQTMQNQNLSPRQYNIARIAAFTATGELDQLKPALADGLNQGLSINEIKEVLVQMYAYAGFPRSLNGINTFMSLLDERKAKGIADLEGHAPTPPTDSRDKYTRGKAVLETLTGHSDLGKSTGFGAFCPQIETFLKEHLFADIFDSDTLSYTDRELATVAALSSLKGVEPMLQSHIGMGLHVGLSPAQLQEVFDRVTSLINPQQAQIAHDLLAKAKASR